VAFRPDAARRYAACFEGAREKRKWINANLRMTANISLRRWRHGLVLDQRYMQTLVSRCVAEGSSLLAALEAMNRLGSRDTQTVSTMIASIASDLSKAISYC
jgi:hypothetical protein